MVSYPQSSLVIRIWDTTITSSLLLDLMDSIICVP